MMRWSGPGREVWRSGAGWSEGGVSDQARSGRAEAAGRSVGSLRGLKLVWLSPNWTSSQSGCHSTSSTCAAISAFPSVLTLSPALEPLATWPLTTTICQLSNPSVSTALMRTADERRLYKNLLIWFKWSFFLIYNKALNATNRALVKRHKLKKNAIDNVLIVNLLT